MILTALIFITVLCYVRKYLHFMFVSFPAYFKTGSCCNLEILWIQDSKRCIITIKRNGKRRILELFSKEYVKIKDPNELISKDNLTDSDK